MCLQRPTQSTIHDNLLCLSCLVDDSDLEWWEILLIVIGCVVAVAGCIVVTIACCRHHNNKKEAVTKATSACK